MGVEVRHPFHDRRIVEFALSLPAPQRWSGGLSKLVICNATRGRLPIEEQVRRCIANPAHQYFDVRAWRWFALAVWNDRAL